MLPASSRSITEKGSCTRTSTSSPGVPSPSHQRQVHFACRHLAVRDTAEAAVGRLQRALATRVDQRFGAAAIVDQVGDGADLQTVRVGELLQVGQARHAAVVLHDLADHGRGREARQLGEIAARFGVTGAHQHAAVLRLQREDVAGLHQIGGLRIARAPRPAWCARGRPPKCRSSPRWPPRSTP